MSDALCMVARTVNWTYPCARCIEIRAESYAGGSDVVVPGRTYEMYGKTCCENVFK